MKGFKAFILRGNVLDLAVAVVIGAAFAELVKAFVADLITPLVGAIFSAKNIVAFKPLIHGQTFDVGDLVNKAVSFVLVSAIVYFLVVLPVNTLLARMKRGETAPDPTVKKCPECISEVPITARRCKFCTSVLA